MSGFTIAEGDLYRKFMSGEWLTDEEYFKLGEDILMKDPVKMLQLDNYDHKATKKRKRRRGIDREGSVWTSTWGRMLQHEDLEVLESYRCMKFKKLFRMPYELFNEFVEECKEVNMFDSKRESLIPIEFKILISLRILGYGTCQMGVEEVSEVAESTIGFIFKQFCEGMCEKLYSKYVVWPEGDKLKEIQKDYEMLGFPGCVGSIDCTHVRWDKCPKKDTLLYTGKEGYPSIAVQCMVDHKRIIHHCSLPFPGTYNDKTITINDKPVSDFMQGKINMDSDFVLYNLDGSTLNFPGGYAIVDGGYFNRNVFMDPMHNRFTIYEVIWSEWEESVRKDVECTFGMLKQRFRILKNPLQYHSKDFNGKIIRTCCILHNILLLKKLEEINWEELNPDENDSSLSNQLNTQDLANHISPVPISDYEQNQINEQLNLISTQNHLGLTQHNFTGKNMRWDSTERGYNTLRQCLVNHFIYKYFKGEIKWPKNFKNSQKLTIPTNPNVVKRIYDDRFI